MGTHARQKVFEATYALVGSGPLTMRLTHAANCLTQIREEDIPQEILEDVKVLKATLLGTPLSSAYRFERRTLSPKKAREAAKRIFELYTKLLGGI
jgi:hypothetical protein